MTDLYAVVSHTCVSIFIHSLCVQFHILRRRDITRFFHRIATIWFVLYAFPEAYLCVFVNILGLLEWCSWMLLFRHVLWLLYLFIWCCFLVQLFVFKWFWCGFLLLLSFHGSLCEGGLCLLYIFGWLDWCRRMIFFCIHVFLTSSLIYLVLFSRDGLCVLFVFLCCWSNANTDLHLFTIYHTHECMNTTQES